MVKVQSGSVIRLLDLQDAVDEETGQPVKFERAEGQDDALFPVVQATIKNDDSLQTKTYSIDLSRTQVVLQGVVTEYDQKEIDRVAKKRADEESKLKGPQVRDRNEPQNRPR